MAPDPEILSAKKVAEILQQDGKDVEDLFAQGLLPGRRIGQQWYTTRRQLLDYIEGRIETPATPKPSPKTPLHDHARISLRPVRPVNSWNCGRCGILNDVEQAECKVCGEPRDVPLMGYIPKR